MNLGPIHQLMSKNLFSCLNVGILTCEIIIIPLVPKTLFFLLSSSSKMETVSLSKECIASSGNMYIQFCNQTFLISVNSWASDFLI